MRADALRGFRELAGELGGDGDALLRSAGIDPAALADGDSYISFRRVINLLERAAAELSCPDFGMRMAVAAGPDILGPLSVAMRTAETPREALVLAGRFMHFHNPSVVLRIGSFDTGHDFIGVGVRMRRLPRATQVFERGVAMTHRALVILCGPEFRPSAVWMSHAAISPPAVYRAVFGVAPAFRMPENGVIVARGQLDALQPARNAQIKRMAEHFLESVAPMRDDALAPRARLVVGRMMRAGGCAQSDLASTLGLHERTLQRRLKAEDTSFDAIKDDVRRDIAQMYLPQKQVPLSHIAEMLGYAEASAFTRACQRWFGASPREVRKRAAA